MKHHQIKLTGPSTHGKRISANLLAELLNLLNDGVRASLRFRAEGSSTKPGAPPSWLLDAADFEITGINEGSTLIEIDAMPLAEAAPEKFQQQQLFWNFDSTNSGFGLFEEALSDALAGKADSELFDSTILGICTRFKNVLVEGIDAVQISNGLSDALEIKHDGVDRIRQLKTETPLPRRVRIAGKLDMIKAAGAVFDLVIQSGERVRGILSYESSELMKQYFNEDVIVSGVADFRPSGRILRINADQIEEAVGDVRLWSKLPKPVSSRLAYTLRKPQTQETGVSVIIGKWPGDETDAEIEELLEQIS